MTIGTKYYGVKGCKITMAQPVGGRWMIQSVLIPKNGGVEMNEELALQIANHIQDRIEREGQWTAVMCRDNETKRYISKIKGQHIERDEGGRFAPHAAEEFGAESKLTKEEIIEYLSSNSADYLNDGLYYKVNEDTWTLSDLFIRQYLNNLVDGFGMVNVMGVYQYLCKHKDLLIEYNMVSKDGWNNSGLTLWENYNFDDYLERFGDEEFGAEIASGLHKCDACGKRTETYYDEVWSDMYCREACARGKPDKCRGSCGENGWEVEFNSVNHRGFSNRPSIDSVYGVSIYCKDCGVGFYGDMRNEIYEQEPDRGESKELRAEGFEATAYCKECNKEHYWEMGLNDDVCGLECRDSECDGSYDNPEHEGYHINAKQGASTFPACYFGAKCEKCETNPVAIVAYDDEPYHDEYCSQCWNTNNMVIEGAKQYYQSYNVIPAYAHEIKYMNRIAKKVLNAESWGAESFGAEETIFREIVRIKSADWNDWKRFNEEHYPYSKRKIAELWNQYKISGECVGEDCICKRSGEEFEAQRGMKS